MRNNLHPLKLNTWLLHPSLVGEIVLSELILFTQNFYLRRDKSI